MVKEGDHSDDTKSPPPMEESWWAAVLSDEVKVGTTKRSAYPESNGPGKRSQVLESPEDWEWVRGLYENDDTVDLPVLGYNRGGLLVEARNLRGFIPVSHIIDMDESLDESLDEVARTKFLEGFVGECLCLKVIELDSDRGRLVFSQRAAAAGPGRRLELFSQLKPGDRVCGTVTNITRFGVFIDLGGVEGLIHVSELSWGRVRHPEDVVQTGTAMEVMVLSVDRDMGRVALSLKELLPDPWEQVGDRYHIGEIADGKVTNVVKFGAFVGIENGLEGLIHISELGDGKFMHPRSVISEGESVRVRIIHIDAAARRLGLSIRNVPQTDAQTEFENGNDQLELLSS